MATEVRFTLNGQAASIGAAPAQTLLDALRHTLGLRGTRQGCGLGQCGACSVIVDGRAVTSCDLPLEAVAGRRVTTIEGLGTRAAPHRLQTAFVELQALQCGYCTSGILMRAAALLERDPHPGEADIRAALAHHLCRCGVHDRVLRAIRMAAR
ncbi:MAG: (2Fe-2S)-binding protein [Burkholderiales bacterium]|nr:(2Fe-2S)-binding protein [Burkholderiales bacterium]